MEVRIHTKRLVKKNHPCKTTPQKEILSHDATGEEFRCY